MRHKLVWVFVATAVAGAAGYVSSVSATPAAGFVGTTIAKGRFGEIEVMNHLAPPRGRGGWDHRDWSGWFAVQKTKGNSDLYVQNNVWAVGGSTGWHTHPGHSLIIVTAGTVTSYQGDDPQCAPHVYTTGMGFVDEGGDHVHLLRNEGDVEARTVAVQLVPADAVRRIDAPAPAGCSF